MGNFIEKVKVSRDRVGVVGAMLSDPCYPFDQIIKSYGINHTIAVLFSEPHRILLVRNVRIVL